VEAVLTSFNKLIRLPSEGITKIFSQDSNWVHSERIIAVCVQEEQNCLSFNNVVD